MSSDPFGGVFLYPVRILSDVGPTSSTTLANITGLFFDVVANKAYNVLFKILFQTSAATHGLKLAVTFPTSPTVLSYNVAIPSTLSTIVHGFGTASDDAVTASTSPLANTTYQAEIRIVLRNGNNAGIVQARYASSSGLGNVTIKAQSLGILTTIP